jgi:hypothetical protein
MEESKEEKAVDVDRIKELSEASGDIKDKSKLVCFIYLLGRDHLPLGEIEGILTSMEKAGGDGYLYTNGWLAQYAQDIAKNLTD